MKKKQIDVFQQERNWKKNFSFFIKNPRTIYLDSAATALKPREVIESINNCYSSYSLNVHSGTDNILFKKINDVIKSTRILAAELIGSNYEEEIIFLPSATYALNLLSLACESFIKEGDEIALTYLEHSSNCFPWEALAKKKKANIVFLPLKNAVVSVEDLKKHINKKTKIVSLFHVSNSLGTINPITEIVKVVKNVSSSCLVFIDACQSIVDQKICVEEWKVDGLVFSSHKLYGPTGLGVLWMKKNNRLWLNNPFWGGGNKLSPFAEKKEKENDTSPCLLWEVGTPPLSQIFGLNASLLWFKKKKKDILKNIFYLKRYALEQISQIDEIKVYNGVLGETESDRIISFNFVSFHPHDVANYLAKQNIILRGGDFCCPYLEKVIGSRSALRVSLDIFNDKFDINKLVFFLKKIKDRIFLENLAF